MAKRIPLNLNDFKVCSSVDSASVAYHNQEPKLLFDRVHFRIDGKQREADGGVLLDHHLHRS